MSPSHNKLSIETISPDILQHQIYIYWISSTTKLSKRNTSHTNKDASCNETLSLCASREYVEVPCAPITTQRSSLLTNSSAKLVHAFNIYIYMDKVTCIDTCPKSRTPLTTCAYCKHKTIFYKLTI